MREDVLRQIWPVFVAEAHEHVSSIGTVVMALEGTPGSVEAVDAIRRTAHALKGSAASLGLSDIEVLAHGVEEVLAGFDPATGLGRVAVGSILHVLEAIEAALSAADAGGEPRVAERERLLEGLRGARAEDATAMARLERAVERLCTPLSPEERGALAAEAAAVAETIHAAAAGAPADLAA
ncbi:MAG TPA: Hpt domain-containing protein, partial [Anaeromyxobacteraceae bacterium]|nr:Hpt domain-containing protein [Anaeromyxobacteraceae bacterium]